ncbi:MAG: hypothetical protein ACRC0L_07365, partial [Angustibacter sp.]
MVKASSRAVGVGRDLLSNFSRCVWVGASRGRCAAFSANVSTALGQYNEAIVLAEHAFGRYANQLERIRAGALSCQRLWSHSEFLRRQASRERSPVARVAADVSANAALASADHMAEVVIQAMRSAVDQLRHDLLGCRSLIDDRAALLSAQMRASSAELESLGIVGPDATFVEYDDSAATPFQDSIATSAFIWNHNLRNVKLLRGGENIMLRYMNEHTGNFDALFITQGGVRAGRVFYSTNLELYGGVDDIPRTSADR